MAEEVEFKLLHIPTRFRFPLWARRNSITLRGALARLKIGDIVARRIGDFKPRNLVRPYLFPHLPASLSPEVYYRHLEAENPVDGVEVVEWMRIAAVDNAILSARKLEYERVGSEIEGESGDARIPGVRIPVVKYISDHASTVRARGYAMAQSAKGIFNVPYLRKNPGIFSDLLTYGTMSYCWPTLQWGGMLVFWRDLASTPIRQTIGFIMDRRGNQIPHFFEQLPLRPSITTTVRQIYNSADAQTLTLTFRDPTNYTRSLGTKRVDIAEGESEISWTMRAFPYVPPCVTEIAPQDNVECALEEYVVV